MLGGGVGGGGNGLQAQGVAAAQLEGAEVANVAAQTSGLCVGAVEMGVVWGVTFMGVVGREAAWRWC